MIEQIHPMLAYKPPLGSKGKELLEKILSNEDKIWGYDEKKDGSRYLSHFIPGKTVYTGRRVSDITGLLSETCGGKLEHLNFDVPNLYGTVLDGEYMGTSAASLGQHAYYVFDIVKFKGRDLCKLSLAVRHIYRELAVEILKSKYPDAMVYTLPFHKITSKKQAEEYYEELINSGGEGLVLKNINSLYLPGKRNRDSWVKMKKEETFDVVIKGHEKSNSDKYGPKGLNTFRHLYGYQYDSNGNFVLVTNIPATSFRDSEHIKMKKIGIDNLDGKVAEIQAMERQDGSVKLRHPRFKRWRDDKNSFECTINDI